MSSTNPRNRKLQTGGVALIRKWAPLAIVIAALIGGYLFGIHEYLSLSNLIRQRSFLADFVSENTFTAIAVYMAIYIVLVAVSFPGGLALSITSGFVFGWFIAGLATVVAATIGATIIFLIARSTFGSFLRDRAGSMLGKMIEGFRKDAFQYLLTLRLVPAFPFWAVNIVPGLLNMKLVPYMVATFIGIIPGTFAFTYLGTGLNSIIAEQENADPGCADAGTCSIDAGALVTKDLLFALAFLAALSFVPFVVKKFRGQER